MTIFYSDIYYPVMLHLSLATKILNENSVRASQFQPIFVLFDTIILHFQVHVTCLNFTLTGSSASDSPYLPDKSGFFKLFCIIRWNLIQVFKANIMISGIIVVCKRSLIFSSFVFTTISGGSSRLVWSFEGEGRLSLFGKLSLFVKVQGCPRLSMRWGERGGDRKSRFES